jgi:Flp pilus assembly secretin CpaC
MRLLSCLTALLLLTIFAPAETKSSACRVGDPQCIPGARPPSKQDLKQAKKLYERAHKLIKDGKLQDAADALDKALSFAPTVAEYISAREMVRQQMVTSHIEAGNQLLRTNNTVAATAEFSRAVALDPHNDYALQRLQDALPAPSAGSSEPLSPALSVVSESQPVIPMPQGGYRDFHLKGSSRNVVEQIASAFGMKLLFDDSVNTRNIRFDMDQVDFFGALREAAKLAHVFWVPLTPKQLILFNDTQQLRRQYQRTVSATFYLSEASTTQEITETVNMLRALFDIRFAVAQPGNQSVVVRAPTAVVEAAGKVLNNFLTRKPQVTIDVKVYEVSHSLTRQLGISLPLQFQVIDVGAAALALLGQGNTSDLITQLISSGAINQANSSALQSLLSQLQNQNNPLLTTPFVTFGGGKTLSAITVPPLTANFNFQQSDLRSLQTVTLRTAQGNAATLKIGSRYPILNASFAPIFSTPAINQVLQNGSYLAPIPSFTYEDIGINLKATPQVLADNNINLKLEMQMRALTGQSINSVPVISNREYTASLCVPSGSTTAIVGMITKSEQKSLSGLPGFSHIPGLGYLTSTRTTDEQDDELLIVVTPTIVSPGRQSSDQTEVWIPTT